MNFRVDFVDRSYKLTSENTKFRTSDTTGATRTVHVDLAETNFLNQWPANIMKMALPKARANRVK